MDTLNPCILIPRQFSQMQAAGDAQLNLTAVGHAVLNPVLQLAAGQLPFGPISFPEAIKLQRVAEACLRLRPQERISTCHIVQVSRAT